MKTELLRSVAQDILDQKLNLDMDFWCEAPEETTLTAEQAACGTTACLAGHVVVKAGLATLHRAMSGAWYYQLDRDVFPTLADDVSPWERAAYTALEAEGWDEEDDLNSLFHLGTSFALKYVIPHLAAGKGPREALNIGRADYRAGSESVG